MDWHSAQVPLEDHIMDADFEAVVEALEFRELVILGLENRSFEVKWLVPLEHHLRVDLAALSETLRVLAALQHPLLLSTH